MKYFRLTDPQKHESELYGWFDFLKSKNIGCCIVKNNNNTFTLFREGLEYTVHGLKESYEKISGEVVLCYDPNKVFG